MATFKQRCFKCRKNMVLVTHRDRFPVCYDCQKKELDFEIKDPKMKKFFDIPEDFYRQNSFLRSVKMNYYRFGSLTPKQREYFLKTVEELKNPKPKEEMDIVPDETAF